GDTSYRLGQPFLVLATQNPIEQEGTYPLPEAQVDRFMLKSKLTYPSKDEELAILNRMSAIEPDLTVRPVLSPEQILELRRAIDQIYVDEKIQRYIVDVVHSTRTPNDYGLDIAPYVQYGASPRATIFLTRAAKGQAFLDGRGYVTPQDIKSIGYDVLRHRVSVTYEAEAEDITPENLLQRIFDHLKVPWGGFFVVAFATVVSRSPDPATGLDRRSPLGCPGRPSVRRSGRVRRPGHNGAAAANGGAAPLSPFSLRLFSV